MIPLYEKKAYFICEDECKDRNELTYQILKHGNVYSLLVIMTDSYGLKDYVFIYDITHEESIASEVIEMLSENITTPCTVMYILEDLFSELNFHHTH